MKRKRVKRKRMRLKALSDSDFRASSHEENHQWVDDYKSNDEKGIRGRDAENEIIDYFSKFGWTVKERPSKGHDIVFEKNGSQFYTDVKEINEYVDSGKDIEKGRIQIDKKEFDRWVAWEQNNKSNFILFVKVNKVDGSIIWYSSTTSKLKPLIKNSKVDPIKIPNRDLIKFRSYKKLV